jgi:hypothetical protein
MLHHSPMACQRNLTSKLHIRKSDLTVSCHSSAACQHIRKSVMTVSCRSSAAACKIKKTLSHSPVACQCNPTNELHTRKSVLAVSCHKLMARQHTRRVLTVSCRRSAVGHRIKQEIKSSLVPKSKPTSVPTRCRHFHHRSSASSAALEASPSQRHWNQNSSLKQCKRQQQRIYWCSNNTGLTWAKQLKRRSSHPLATALNSRSHTSSWESLRTIHSGPEWNACSSKGHNGHSRR